MHNATKRRPKCDIVKEWENIHNKSWPKGKDGKQLVANHVNPLADRGIDHGSNIEPMTKNQHTKHHSDRGDFSRWAKLAKKRK